MGALFSRTPPGLPAGARCAPGACAAGTACSSAGVCVSANILKYRAGPPLDQLPDCMRTALQNSAAGTQTPADDAVMAGFGTGTEGAAALCNGAKIVPYCQQEAYKDTYYCACQNVQLPFPGCGFVPCQSSSAYRTKLQAASLADPHTHCPAQNICQNIAAASGNEDYIRAHQDINCGGETLVLPPGAIAAIFVLVLILALLLAGSKRRRSAPIKLPPPGALSSLPDLVAN